MTVVVGVGSGTETFLFIDIEVMASFQLQFMPWNDVKIVPVLDVEDAVRALRPRLPMESHRGCRLTPDKRPFGFGGELVTGRWGAVVADEWPPRGQWR
jgi:hypothetical protein